jgi:prepilin-type processing-associated H-X9-DG protein
MGSYFGSFHPAGMNAVFADGSVHLLSYNIAASVFINLCNKADGKTIPMGDY